MKSFSHRLLTATLLTALSLSSALAQNAPTAPPTTVPSTRATSRPTRNPPTLEQRKAIDADYANPADKPAVKLDLGTGTNGNPNPNFGQPDQGFIRKHQAFLERSKQPIGLLFMGDSITEGWNNARDTWAEHYAKYNPANFGIGGDRTQHVLWRIESGELDAIKPNPKVVVLMIGTNNSGNHSAEQITAGITEIVKQTQAKLPESKILLLGIFPRSARPGPLREKLQAINANLAKLDDGSKVRYLEIWNQFLTPNSPDGELTREIMPDALHPNAAGYKIWADAMQPLLDEMMK